MVSIDVYYRLGREPTNHADTFKLPTSVIVLFSFFICLLTACFGVNYGLDYDYCHRKHEGNVLFRWVTTLIYYVIPCFITSSLLIKTTDNIRDRLTKIFRVSIIKLVKRDRNLCLFHTTCYHLFVLAWIPHLVTVIWFPDTSNAVYYTFTLIGLLRSGITSVLYSVQSKKAMGRVLLYLCCKVNVNRPAINHRNRFIETQARMQNGRIQTIGVTERPEGSATTDSTA